MPNRVMFGPADRKAALVYCVRHALDTRQTFVLYYNYEADSWCAHPYQEFSVFNGAICSEDLRFILPNGEVTRYS
jgi:hypothetical protein